MFLKSRFKLLIICSSFYCIILLTTLFVSSCYWQPIPLESPLYRPWSDNITTFAEALNATITPGYAKPLPSVMRAADRCWCDFSSGNFFEPFNVTRWEETSVHKLRDELERQQKIEEAKEKQLTKQKGRAGSESRMPRTAAPTSGSTVGSKAKAGSQALWSLLSPLRFPFTRTASHPEEDLSTSVHNDPPSTSFFRKEYDLRSYGLEMVIDFGWTREDS